MVSSHNLVLVVQDAQPLGPLSAVRNCNDVNDIVEPLSSALRISLTVVPLCQFIKASHFTHTVCHECVLLYQYCLNDRPSFIPSSIIMLCTYHVDNDTQSSASKNIDAVVEIINDNKLHWYGVHNYACTHFLGLQVKVQKVPTLVRDLLRYNLTRCSMILMPLTCCLLFSNRFSFK